MGDMGEIWEGHREAKAAKRAANTVSSTDLLKQNGIAFVSNNAGAHLFVAGKVDFWPATGLWKVRGRTHGGRRGVQSLLKFLKGERNG
jgi:hypothetical protein